MQAERIDKYLVLTVHNYTQYTIKHFDKRKEKFSIFVAVCSSGFIHEID